MNDLLAVSAEGTGIGAMSMAVHFIAKEEFAQGPHTPSPILIREFRQQLSGGLGKHLIGQVAPSHICGDDFENTLSASGWHDGLLFPMGTKPWDARRPLGQGLKRHLSGKLRPLEWLSAGSSEGLLND